MPTEKEATEALKRYREKFDEGFPTFYFTSNNDIEGMIKEINKAIKTGKPYEPELEEEKNGEPVFY